MVTINFLAVLVVAVVDMVLGSIWYGPLFMNAWGRIIGVDMNSMTPEKKKEMQKKMWPTYLLNFVLALLTAYVLAKFIYMSAPVPGASGGMMIAFWIWLGFLMPMAAGASMWGGKPKKLAWQMFWITAIFQLIAALVGGAILGAWQ